MKTETPELKPCPFCGSKHISIYHDDYVCSCKISCECGGSFEYASDCMTQDELEKYVVEKWNIRDHMKSQKVDQPMNPLAVKQITSGDKGLYKTCANWSE